MTFSALYVLATFIISLVALAKWQGKAEPIFGITLLALYLPGFITNEALLASASNSGLLTLVLLICAAFVLERTILLQRFAAWMLSADFNKSWWRVMMCSILSSSLLNNTAVVSMLIGPLREARRHPTRRLILPMTYAVSMGGMLTLVGTSTNLIVNTMVIEVGLPALDLLDFLPVGAIAALVGLGWLWLARNLLPSRPLYVKGEEEHYLVEARLAKSSTLVGKTIAQAGLRHLSQLFLVEIVRKDRTICPVSPATILVAGDRLLFSGEPTAIGMLGRFPGLVSYARRQGISDKQLTEVLLLPDSPLCGGKLRDSDFRAKFDAAVIAIKRDGLALSGSLGEQVLTAGDFIILATGPDFSGRSNLSKNFIVIKGAKPSVVLTPLVEWLMIMGFILSVGLSALGVISLFKAMVFYFSGLLLSGALSLNEIRRRFPLGLWLIVMAALALAKAMESSGLMASFSRIVSYNLADISPRLSLLILLIVTWLVTELVTNNATAAMMTPIALALAKGMGVSEMPFVMAVAYAASCSFINPFSYQTNLMALRAGEYCILDYVKMGLPLSIFYISVLFFSIPVFFPF